MTETKRGPGRPPGSKNKNTSSKSTSKGKSKGNRIELINKRKDLRDKENEEIKLEKKRSSADDLGIYFAKEAYGVKVCNPMNKTFFCTFFINEFKRLYAGHSCERDECAENNAEEYGYCRKDKGVFKAFKNEYLPIFPYEHDYVLKTEHYFPPG